MVEASSTCILLISSYTAGFNDLNFILIVEISGNIPIKNFDHFLDLGQDQDQRRARDMLTSKGIVFEEIDGALEENKVRRNELFECSGARGKYPQIFINNSDGTLRFVGMWDQLETLNDLSQLPPETLAQNPDIETFEQVFGDVARR